LASAVEWTGRGDCSTSTAPSSFSIHLPVRYVMQRQMNAEPQDLRFSFDGARGDQLLIRSVKGAAVGEAIAVTDKGADIYKSAVAVAGDGNGVGVLVAEQNYKPFPNNPAANFDIWARSLAGGKLGEAVKISESTKTIFGPWRRPIQPARCGSPGRALATARSRFCRGARPAMGGRRSKSSALSRAIAGPRDRTTKESAAKWRSRGHL